MNSITLSYYRLFLDMGKLQTKSEYTVQKECNLITLKTLSFQFVDFLLKLIYSFANILPFTIRLCNVLLHLIAFEAN